MEITDVNFKKVKNKMFLFIYYSNGKRKSYIVKDKYKNRIFELLVDIIVADK